MDDISSTRGPVSSPPRSRPDQEHQPSKLDGSCSLPTSSEASLNRLCHDSNEEVTTIPSGIEDTTTKHTLPPLTKDITTPSTAIENGTNPGKVTNSKLCLQVPTPLSPVRKLSPTEIENLTASPGSAVLRTAPLSSDTFVESQRSVHISADESCSTSKRRRTLSPARDEAFREVPINYTPVHRHHLSSGRRDFANRARPPSRVASIPKVSGNQFPLKGADESFNPFLGAQQRRQESESRNEYRNSGLSPKPQEPLSSASLPLPPLSMPTFLQLELSADRPSPLYIHSSSSVNTPYESSRVKVERLLNFLSLPPHLERTLFFGTLACLDAWLYTITILPLRFLKAAWIFVEWLAQCSLSEILDLTNFIYQGAGRLWHRHRRKGVGSQGQTKGDKDNAKPPEREIEREILQCRNSTNSAKQLRDFANARLRHPTRQDLAVTRNRFKLKPSLLQSNHKADLLQGLLIVACSTILMRFDASRMYHAVKGQSAIKLYVIYNGLEVCDRLFSALGQDIMECLFSRNLLDRNAQGRSIILRPAGMFVLGLVYSAIHSTALLYQVVTLNVAVNSYSNALLTLLISNQFVEIKGSVFKRIEKENLFQLTCADVVERFQLWIMLLIIALRNVVEMGGFKISFGDASTNGSMGDPAATNGSDLVSRLGNILPHGFTILPSLPLEVFLPFLIVIGSEMLVDWLKHAYINKFNAISPSVYGRFLDVLAKDYYSNAFTEQNLTKRLGLPVIPLSCLFIRSTLQTYHMFLAQNVPPPIASTATSLSESEASTPVSTAVLAHLDHIFREALGRSTFGGASTASRTAWYQWSMDDVIAFATMTIFFLVIYLVLLAFKLALGISLLGFARSRYKGMRRREQQRVVEHDSRRQGQWAVVEMDEDKRQRIYEGDADGLSRVRTRQAKAKVSSLEAVDRLDGVDRYSMVAKRIW